MYLSLIRLACVAYWLMLTVLLLVPDPIKLLGLKRATVAAMGQGTHFFFFLALAVLVSASRWPIRGGVLAAALVGFAFVTEGLQWFVPRRHVDPIDLIENLAGLLAGVLIWQAFSKMTAKGRSHRLTVGQAPERS